MISHYKNRYMLIIFSLLLSTIMEGSTYYTKKDEFKAFVIRREILGYIGKALWATDKFSEVKIKSIIHYLRENPANSDYISFLLDGDRTTVEQMKRIFEEIRTLSVDVQEEIAKNMSRACEALFHQGIPENLTAVLSSLQLALGAATSW